GILLFAGCAKDHRIAKGDPTGLIDWGRVELSVNTPKRMSLGEGKDCTFTAVSAANGNLEFKIETKEKVASGEMPPGALPPKLPPGTPVEITKTSTGTVPSGVQVFISVGQRRVRFTPILKGV
ncbi:MAG TPA: hypothetical protein VNZ22_16360, partial [Bacillota bacterium]|nr:hypothetical protein [Bacillota bacterium]